MSFKKLTKFKFSNSCSYLLFESKYYIIFIENKKETMNIIHFENSSNNGITENPENGEPEINLTVQGFYPSISTKTFLSQGKFYFIINNNFKCIFHIFN